MVWESPRETDNIYSSSYRRIYEIDGVSDDGCPRGEG
ncbi:hypothetical protein J2X69_002930 [Algoriphagus sp. 4150]|nr:hypothetical protein [Algoriphagus sp. 4150]